MENLVRELRTLLGKNQVEFARMVGRSYASIRNYERHPEDTPRDVIDRLKTIAAESGHADMAVALISDDWRIRTLLHPPGDFIMAAEKGGLNLDPENQRWHTLLDEILNSDNDKAITAVQHNLICFHDYIKTPKRNIEKKKKIG